MSLLNNSITGNLFTLVVNDIGQPIKRSGSTYFWRCPFHSDKSPSFAVYSDQDNYYCFGCGMHGDAIEWMKEYRHCSFVEAIKLLGVEKDFLIHPPTRTLHLDPAYAPPSKEWQDKAKNIIEQCQKNLWSIIGSTALDYLRNKRGFKDQTIKHFRLGYSTGITFGSIYVPRGIIIPCVVDGRVWYVKIRQPKSEDPDRPKYTLVKGSHPVALYGADSLKNKDTAIIVEGEFDVMSCWQEAGIEFGCVTFGSATNTPDLASWGEYLRELTSILISGDNDEAGKEGVDRLVNLFGPRAQYSPLPGGYKDPNELLQSGKDFIIDWLNPYLEIINKEKSYM
jgi:DNA primase